jgi:hypothetical protein
MPNGRIVVSFDQTGPGVKKLPGKKGQNPHFNHRIQGMVCSSGDGGETWEATHHYPFGHASLFRDGTQLYLLGDAGNLYIANSADGGLTWQSEVDLTGKQSEGSNFALMPSEVLCQKGVVYVAGMRITDYNYRGQSGSVYAPFVMRAASGSNLRNLRQWSFSQLFGSFRDRMDTATLHGVGIPFYDVPQAEQAQQIAPGRWADRIGWYAPHVVALSDPDHALCLSGKPGLFMLMQFDAHRADMAVLLRIQDNKDEEPVLEPVKTPAGHDFSVLPMPGGHMKFHPLWDKTSRLYWLVSNRGGNSMTRPDKLPRGYKGMPGQQRNTLQLHFSPNLVDWSFAGLINTCEDKRVPFYEPAAAIHGDDLYVVARTSAAGNRVAKNTHRIACCKVPAFRELVY